MKSPESNSQLFDEISHEQFEAESEKRLPKSDLRIDGVYIYRKSLQEMDRGNTIIEQLIRVQDIQDLDGDCREISYVDVDPRSQEYETALSKLIMSYRNFIVEPASGPNKVDDWPGWPQDLRSVGYLLRPGLPAADHS
jgi:hypothetical protein